MFPIPIAKLRTENSFRGSTLKINGFRTYNLRNFNKPFVVTGQKTGKYRMHYQMVCLDTRIEKCLISCPGQFYGLAGKLLFPVAAGDHLCLVKAL
jgi:hypothetical protein